MGLSGTGMPPNELGFLSLEEHVVDLRVRVRYPGGMPR